MKAGVNHEPNHDNATKTIGAGGMAMPLSGKRLPSGSPQLPETRAYLSNHAEFQVDNMELKLIAELAYRYWEDRGRPWGSSEEDWFRAEHELRRSRGYGFKTGTRDSVSP